MTPNSSPLSLHKVRTGKTRVVVFSLLAMVTMLVAACGGANPSTGKTAGPVTLNILASPNGNYTSANFNPFIQVNAGGLYGAQGMLYETLAIDNRYNGVITPMLASDYKLADDVKSITFTLRQGVQWSDGQPFTADDVVFTLNMLKQYPSLDLQGLWSGVIKDVVSPDANTVKVDFLQPDSTAIWYLSQTFIVPKHIWSSVSDPTKYTDNNPIGTGPYTLKSFTPQAYLFQKNPKYWQPGKPQIDQLRYVATNDNTTAQLMVSKGEIDWAGIGWDPKFDATFTDRDPQHYHHWFPGNNTVILYLNLTKFPFNILAVRQAMSLAINRPEIQQKAAPFAAPANPSSILLPAHKDFLAPEFQDAQYTQDLDKANALMQQAGFTKGSDGIYAKDGKKASFSMIVPNGWSDWQSSLAVIADNLKQLGLDAQVNALATPDLYTTNLNKGDFDAAISWTDKGPTPFFFLNDWLASTKTWTNGKIATGTNWEHWQDPATDKLLGQYLNSADPAVQKQAIQGLEKIVADQLPSIPLDYNVGWFEYTTVHAIGWPDKDNTYDFGSPFDAPDNEFIVLHLQPVK